MSNLIGNDLGCIVIINWIGESLFWKIWGTLSVW